VFALHIILILCTVALVAAAFAVYRLVRSHMSTAHRDATVAGTQTEIPPEQKRPELKSPELRRKTP
jgi:hypothetical protein